MKKLPIGIQNLSEIIENDYAYVDKTGIAVDLIDRYKYVFLSRPRRFGKSLFVDTLHNLFAGNKELFAGLAAEKSHDWSKNYPVIRIEFSEGNFRNRDSLRLSIISAVIENEKRLGVCAESPEPALRFAQLIRETARKYNTRAVVLIDEYDKPILDNIDHPEMAVLAREELKSLYSAVKGNDAHIRFAFLTGVTKFSKVSIFSGINTLVDISLEKLYGTICGYTRHDLETVFAEHLEEFSRATGSKQPPPLFWSRSCGKSVFFCRNSTTSRQVKNC